MQKKCCACEQYKSYDEFGRDKRSPTGLKSRCKICEAEYMRLYKYVKREDFNEYMRGYRRRRKEQKRPIVRKVNKERHTEYNRKYREEHREERAEKMRLDREKRPEHYKEINRRSYHKNKDARRAMSKAAYQAKAEERKKNASIYRKKNHDKVLKWNGERRVKKLNLPGSHTLEQWQWLCNFFNGICPRCGEKKRLTVDHIIPISQSDSSDFITNIQPLCKNCNSSKSDSDRTDYRPEYVKIWAHEQMNLCLQ